MTYVSPRFPQHPRSRRRHHGQCAVQWFTETCGARVPISHVRHQGQRSALLRGISGSSHGFQRDVTDLTSLMSF